MQIKYVCSAKFYPRNRDKTVVSISCLVDIFGYTRATMTNLILCAKCD